MIPEPLIRALCAEERTFITDSLRQEVSAAASKHAPGLNATGKTTTLRSALLGSTGITRIHCDLHGSTRRDAASGALNGTGKL